MKNSSQSSATNHNKLRFAAAFGLFPALLLAQPQITSVIPLSAAPGTSVTIVGANFDATPGANTVYFGPVRATVTAASANSLTVQVPFGASFGPISVTTPDRLTAYSARSFLPSFGGSTMIGASSFGAEVLFPTPAATLAGGVSDMDSDGKPDLLTSGGGGSPQLTGFLNTSLPGMIDSSSFAAGVGFDGSGGAYGLAIGDLDGDGKLDAVVPDTSVWPGPRLAFYRNFNNVGSLADTLNVGSIWLPPTAWPHSLAIADLDMDGRPDLIIPDYSNDLIYLLRNVGDSGGLSNGSFSEPAAIPAVRAYQLAVGDLDDDGKPDIVVAGLDGMLHVLRNTATTGTLGVDSITPAGNIQIPIRGENGLPSSAALADLDGDGKTDVILANFGYGGPNHIPIFRNVSTLGSVAFEQPLLVPTSGSCWRSEVADFNGDGKPDFVLCHYVNGEGATVFQNNSTPGNVSIAPAVLLGGDISRPSLLSVGDFDLDGKPDVVVARDIGGRFSVFRNTMDGGMVLPLSITCPPDIQQATAVGANNAVVTFSATTSGGVAPIVIAYSQQPGTPFLVGTTTVTCTATDAANNTASCSFTVRIQDTEPPTISQPPHINASTDPGVCSATVHFSPSATDNCSGSVPVVCSPPSGSTFPKGTTTVQCTATDAAGNTAHSSFDVIVTDNQSPTLVCPADITVPCSLSRLLPVNFTVSASDNCDSAPAIISIPASGSSFPVGPTTVNSTATDASANQSTCSFTVTRLPLGFDGFHAPIGGADTTGGNYLNPLRTFKLGKKIQVKFQASCGGAPVLSGVHRLQVIKFSNDTTFDPPIDASSSDPATPGDQFVLQGNYWTFTLDTEATGMSAGKWKLVATLSDGSDHYAWIQLKP